MIYVLKIIWDYRSVVIGTYRPQYRSLSAIRYLDANPLPTRYTLFSTLVIRANNASPYPNLFFYQIRSGPDIIYTDSDANMDFLDVENGTDLDRCRSGRLFKVG
jgi:hypothetical protein